MPTKKHAYSQAVYRRNVRKLQRAGVIGKVDLRRKASPSTLKKFTQYKDLLTGHASAVKAPSTAQAKELRKKFGLRGAGTTVIVPKERGEKIRITRGEIKSTRPGYRPGEKISKTYGGKFTRPTGPRRAYYTLPERRRGLGKIKRHTFASFDELLFYLSKYEIDFEEIEDYIEVEEVSEGGRKDKALAKTIAADRAAAYRRNKRKRRRKTSRR